MFSVPVKVEEIDVCPTILKQQILNTILK